MAAQWFCKISDQELGPMTAQQLSGLVRAGRLGPNDLVRKDDSKWVVANRVKGLFPSEPSAGQTTTVTRHEVTADWAPGQTDDRDVAPSTGSVPSGGGGSTGVSSGAESGNGAAGGAANLTPGSTLGNYRILDTLGEGGMGVVLKAQHIRMERLVALKVLRGQATESPAAIKRFHQEVRAAARLSHPNIVTAFDADEVQGLHFLVMEYVHGDNLADYLAQRGKLEIAQAVDFASQAARGLEYAHGEGVVHRDIKPGNLLLDKRGVVKILDMGLASIRESQDSSQEQVHADVTQANQLLGTFDYMPPEQAEDPRGVDHRADIYSLGCTLYRLITGHLPFRGDSPLKKILAHRDQPIPSLRDPRPEVPLELDRVFKKMLAKKPDERFQSMGEVIDALSRALENRPFNAISSSGNQGQGIGGAGLDGSSGSTMRIAPPADDDGEYRLGGVGHLRAAGPEPMIVPSGESDDDDLGGFQLAPVDGSEERWYWQCMGQETGPFTLRQLRSKKLSPDDQVRRESGRKWFRAAEIRGLF